MSLCCLDLEKAASNYPESTCLGSFATFTACFAANEGFAVKKEFAVKSIERCGYLRILPLSSATSEVSVVSEIDANDRFARPGHKQNDLLIKQFLKC
jgi:hypothetical protein